MRWNVRFYQRENGEIPVYEFLCYFLFSQDTFVLLHGFRKKTNKTPPKELERAMQYKLDYERRCQDETGD